MTNNTLTNKVRTWVAKHINVLEKEYSNNKITDTEYESCLLELKNDIDLLRLLAQD